MREQHRGRGGDGGGLRLCILRRCKQLRSDAVLAAAPTGGGGEGGHGGRSRHIIDELGHLVAQRRPVSNHLSIPFEFSCC